MSLPCGLNCLHSLHSRWITLIVEYLAIFIVGAMYSMPAYTQDIKQFYNLSQRQCKYLLRRVLYRKAGVS